MLTQLQLLRPGLPTQYFIVLDGHDGPRRASRLSLASSLLSTRDQSPVSCACSIRSAVLVAQPDSRNKNIMLIAFTVNGTMLLRGDISSLPVMMFLLSDALGVDLFQDLYRINRANNDDIAGISRLRLRNRRLRTSLHSRILCVRWHFTRCRDLVATIGDKSWLSGGRVRASALDAYRAEANAISLVADQMHRRDATGSWGSGAGCRYPSPESGTFGCSNVQPLRVVNRPDFPISQREFENGSCVDLIQCNKLNASCVFKWLFTFFNLGRHLVSAKNYRFFRLRAFASWN